MRKNIEIFLIFLQIGATAFGGGYATLPLIEQIIVNQKGWITLKEMLDMITISQMTPGPIVINAATFVGTKINGVVGAVVATVANVIPQTIFMMILGYFIFRGAKIKFISKILNGLRPGVVGLICSATLSIILSAILKDGKSLEFDYLAVLGLIFGFVLYLKKIDMFKLIIGAAIGSVLIEFVIISIGG